MTAAQTHATATETVAVLGAGGTMGFPIARNLARAGIPVRAWNRSRDKANGHRADDPNGPQDAIWVQMSTIGEAATKRCAELANRAGVGFVDALMIARDFAPAFRLTLAAKDAGLVRQAADDRGMDLPLLDAIAPAAGVGREDPRRRGFQRNLPDQQGPVRPVRAVRKDFRSERTVASVTPT